ncbi:MAG TPA: PQQ-dependent sugar dehydrogenase, partial [Cytophagales bacterium]
MKYIFSALLLLLLLACNRERPEKRLLVYTSPAGAARIGNLLAAAKDNNLRVDTTSNGAYLHEDSLPRYSAVVLWYADVNQMGSPQQADVQRYVQAGGGLVSVGPPVASPYQWRWYYALTHRQTDHPEGAAVAVRKVSTAAATAQHPRLASEYDGGRVFVLPVDTAGTDAAKAAPVQTLKEGLAYAVGDNQETDYDKARSPRVPEENRFVKVPLAGDFDEPMQIEIAKDGRVFVIERKGALKLYDPETKSVRVIARLDVFSLLEDGLLGMALDPAFDRNGWAYFFYSPAGNVPKQHVSRFTMKGDSLLMNTEKVLLEIPVQRETCCHSGGGLEFGPDGLLYISAGDNTSSKESSGYTPLDERPGRAPFDSQKSSANTNDLRGKILRIRPEPNGTYTIPVGNLFHKSEPNTRPEIYAMGCRNPFRFTIDKRGWVYWGDVGPDSGVDSLRGPQSYDEFNQAREAGYFGWPYFVADNKAYPDYDFATNTILEEYQNPLKPVNLSPNNTGRRELPPAQKPMIWYPYGPSETFPMLGTGSRSACAGPFYYAADFKQAPYQFPAYYNDRMFIYEWARGWIKTVAFDRDGNMTQIEDFLPGTPFSKPIDLKFGPDGALYVLDYGRDYFSKNEDALLSRIEYTEGNRPPLPRIAADQTVGAAPLTVRFSAKGSTDYDKADSLRYEWDVPGGKDPSGSAEATHTFTKPGVYKVTLKVTDPQGESATAVQEIKVGNAKPQVQVALAGNQTFFWDNGNIDYQVQVHDKEDGTLGNGIDPVQVDVYFDYLQQG